MFLPNVLFVYKNLTTSESFYHGSECCLFHFHSLKHKVTVEKDTLNITVCCSEVGQMTR